MLYKISKALQILFNFSIKISAASLVRERRVPFISITLLSSFSLKQVIANIPSDFIWLIKLIKLHPPTMISLLFLIYLFLTFILSIFLIIFFVSIDDLTK